MLIGKINASIWFHCMKKDDNSLTEDKWNDKEQKVHTLSEPQKAHPTGELVIVA